MAKQTKLKQEEKVSPNQKLFETTTMIPFVLIAHSQEDIDIYVIGRKRAYRRRAETR